MSNLFKRTPAISGATGNEQFDFCSNPSFLSRETKRGSPAWGAPAFIARNFVRPALQSIALFLIIMVSMMTMVKPAQAVGTVSRVPPYYWYGGVTYPSAEAYCEAVYASLYPNSSAPWRVVYWSGSEWCAKGNSDYYPINKNNCPDHSVPTNSQPNANNTCNCSYSYVPDTTKTSCVLANNCPANMTGYPCACKTGYVPNPAGAGCVLPACPEHANRASPGAPCACDTGYKFDAAGTSCISTCPVDPLPPLPANDLCAQSLEKGAGEDVNKACPELTDEMKKQAQCVHDKIWKLSPPISYSKPSATIRNTAYQNHLVAVWNKSKDIKKADLSDAQKQACAALIAHVERHGIDSPPSQSGNEAPHVQGRAIDIPRGAAEALMRQVATFITMPKPPGCLPCNDVITIIGDVQDYVNSATENPPACNLRWGGRFTPIDRVHFQLP